MPAHYKMETTNKDCLHLIFSHLNALDLLSVAQTNSDWREVALFRLSLVQQLECDGIRKAFSNRRSDFRQKDFEEIIRYCGTGLQIIDLRSVSCRNVFHDFERLISIINRYCTQIKELYIPQRSRLPNHIAFPPTLTRVELLGHVTEEALQSLARGCPNLDSISLNINMFTTGEFFPKFLSRNQIKNVRLYRCCNITSDIIHFILKNYANSLESFSVSGFPTSEILHFDKSDLSVLHQLRSLEISSWFDRNNFRFQCVSRLLELAPNLENLTVQHCSDLHATPESLTDLTRACQGLSIEIYSSVRGHP